MHLSISLVSLQFLLEPNERVALRDEIPNGIALVDRIQKVSDFGRIPYEGTLDVRDSDLARLHPSE